MATVHQEIEVDAQAAEVWDAARDVGALHSRLVPGFVTRTEMVEGADPPVRRVTFANGVTLEETILSVDDARRRLVWSIRADGVEHHNGALQVWPLSGGRARVVWIADVLPHALAETYGPLMQRGLEVMKRTFESAAPTG